MSLAAGDLQNSPPAAGIWHSLNRLLFTLIVLTVAALVGYRFLPEVSKRREQEIRVMELKAEVERERLLLARKMREVNLLTVDPEYVSLVARDKLDLMKDGETIYRMEPTRPDRTKMKMNR